MSATTDGLEACTAGARPASSAEKIAAPIVNSSTRASIFTLNARGNGSGRLIEVTKEVTHQASSEPTAAPMSDMTSASVTSWRTRRARLAPMASRMPISR